MAAQNGRFVPCARSKTIASLLVAFILSRILPDLMTKAMRDMVLSLHMRAIDKRAYCRDCAKGGCSLRAIGNGVDNGLGVMAMKSR